MSAPPLPPIPEGLIEYLQAVFPDKLPEAPLAPGQLEIQIGQQKVIKHLQAQYKSRIKAGLRA